VEESDVTVLSSYLPWALGVAILLSAVGGAVLGALARRQEGARRRRPLGAATRSRGPRVVDGPVQRGGDWLRLVELDDGRRRLEVLGPQGWEPAERRPLRRLLGL